jgi:hypothetical protein
MERVAGMLDPVLCWQIRPKKCAMPYEGLRISSLSAEPWLPDWMEEIPLREWSGGRHPSLSSQGVNG